MSSLIRSGRTNGSTARVAGAAPTSSRATPQPARRAWATVASSRAGSPTRARSVTSTTTRSRPLARSMAALRSSGQATPNETGSALTNRVSGGPSPPRDGLGEGGRPAGPVQLGHPAGPPGGLEQGRRRLQGRAHRPPGQGLVADDMAVVQVDQRLEDRLHGPDVQDPGEILHRAGAGGGGSGRRHGRLIDRRRARVERPHPGAGPQPGWPSRPTRNQVTISPLPLTSTGPRRSSR